MYSSDEQVRTDHERTMEYYKNGRRRVCMATVIAVCGTASALRISGPDAGGSIPRPNVYSNGDHNESLVPARQM